MKVTNLTLCNFRSFYDVHSLKLDTPGLTFVKGENKDDSLANSNGAGKSSIWSALDWCLFGKTEGSADSVVNREAGNNCWVRADLQDEADTYTIIRARNTDQGNKLTLFVNGTEVEALDTNKTQEYINNAIGISRDIFHAAIYRGQDSKFNFMEAKDSKRKEILTEMLPELAEVDRVKDSISTVLKSIEEELTILNTDVAKLTAQKEALESVNWGDHYKSWTELNTKLIDSVKAELKQSEECLETGLEDKSTELKKSLSLLQKPTTEDRYEQEYKRVLHTFNETKAQKAALEKELKATEALLNKVTNRDLVGSTCSACNQQITQEHIEGEIKLLTEKRDMIAHSLKEYPFDQIKKLLEDTEREYEKEKKLNKELEASFVRQQQTLLHEQDKIKDAVIRNKLLESKIKGYKDRLHELSKAKWPGESEAKASKAKIDNLNNQIASKLVDINALNVNLTLHKFWDKALTGKGIKTYILDKYVSTMTEAANVWISALTGGTMRVVFDTMTETKSGTLSDKLNVRIFKMDTDGEESEIEYESLSGGQKQRISLGVDIGLSSVVANRAKKKWELYILDESFRKNLDDAGREAVFDLLETLVQDKTTVFVVDHTGAEGYFEQILKVELSGGRSRIADADPCLITTSLKQVLEDVRHAA